MIYPSYCAFEVDQLTLLQTLQLGANKGGFANANSFSFYSANSSLSLNDKIYDIGFSK